MKLRTLRIKITLWAGSCLLIMAAIIVVCSLIIMKESADIAREKAINEARMKTAEIAKEYAAYIKAELEMALDTARTLAHVLSGVRSNSTGIRLDRDEVNNILKIILTRNPKFLAVYTCWEPNAFDGKDPEYKDTPGHDKTGRFIPYWSRGEDGNIRVEHKTDYEKEEGEYYLQPKKTRNECIIDPYRYIVQGNPALITSLVAPIVVDDIFYGVAGIDLRLDMLQKQVDTMERFYDGAAGIFLISHNGTLAAAAGSPDLIGKDMKHIHEGHVEQEMALIKKGEEVIRTVEDNLEILIPLRTGQTTTPWSVSIIVPADRITATADVQKHQAERDMIQVIGISILCVSAAMCLLWYVAENIAKPIRRTSYMLKDIAEGDLTKRVDIRSGDELGMLANWFNIFLENFQGIIRDIAGNVDTLNTSSWDFSDISGKMQSGTDEISSKSTNVASATEEVATNINTMASAIEEMSVNVQSVSSTAEQMAQNMNMLASAIEDMSSAINDIAQNVQEGTRVSTQAMEMAKAATLTMNTLGEAAMEIDEVTELIKKIAEQTNLLALNATIEAASAGEAGKGFAVVAKEIKELANQSSQAAENIGKRIKDVQKNTITAVKVIDEVSEIINNINESSTVIMNSVEQQTLTANNISASIRQVNIGAGNIASSIAEVAKGSNDMSRNAAEAARGANDVASNIQDISHAAGKANAGARQVNHSAEELARVAGELQKMVAKFKTKI
ncbi:methyl-accepting chemotaxis protein [Desulfobacterales bacterium HSG2]|nr:methyl-accepting chemotaxis protein [Desulfobacterales bacterium HSG2]